MDPIKFQAAHVLAKYTPEADEMRGDALIFSNLLTSIEFCPSWKPSSWSHWMNATAGYIVQSEKRLLFLCRWWCVLLHVLILPHCRSALLPHWHDVSGVTRPINNLPFCYLQWNWLSNWDTSAQNSEMSTSLKSRQVLRSMLVHTVLWGSAQRLRLRHNFALKDGCGTALGEIAHFPHQQLVVSELHHGATVYSSYPSPNCISGLLRGVKALVDFIYLVGLVHGKAVAVCLQFSVPCRCHAL